MDIIDVINKRYSCREYLDLPIKENDLEKILEAGRMAPTACNFQPERIYVVEDEALLEELKRATRFTFNSKTILVICYNREESWHRGNDSKDHGDIDCAIIAQNMVLTATSLGVGSCYVCSFKEQIVKEILNIEDRYTVSIMLPLGYPKNEGKPNSRKELKDLVIYN